jgi:hypothetical protein
MTWGNVDLDEKFEQFSPTGNRVGSAKADAVTRDPLTCTMNDLQWSMPRQRFGTTGATRSKASNGHVGGPGGGVHLQQ